MNSKYNGHIFYTEDAENVDYQIKYFPSVNDLYFSTTLIDNVLLCGGCDYNNLNEALTIRRAEWSAVKGAYVMARTKISPATPKNEAENLSRFWGGKLFLKIGTEETNPLRSFIPLDQGPTVARVEELKSSDAMDEQQGFHSALSAEKASAVIGWVADIPQTEAIARRLENIPPNHPDPVAMVNQMKPKSPPPSLQPKGKS